MAAAGTTENGNGKVSEREQQPVSSENAGAAELATTTNTDATTINATQPDQSTQGPESAADTAALQATATGGAAPTTPPEKRWRGWPGDCVFRLIVPVVKVGSIIGRKGELIKKMCEETRARIRVLEGAVGTTDRILLISGKEEPEAPLSLAMDAVLRVFKRVSGLSESDGENKSSDCANEESCESFQEMFGRHAPPFDQVSEDEDWGPGKKRRRQNESDAINTLMTLHESESKLPNNDNSNLKEKDSLCIQIRRPCFRIARDAVKKLCQAFAENELPLRSVKGGLSKELGLDAEKVNKWFKNARYLALKTRKQAGGAEQLQSFTFRNRLQNLEKDGPVTTKEVSKTTIDNSKKNNMLHSKQIRKRRPTVSLEKGKRDLVEFSDDVSLKKLLETRKRRAKFDGDSQAAESEFERLSKLKDRVHNLKQRLVSVPNYRAEGSEEPHLNET